MSKGITFDDRGNGQGLVILNRSVWSRIAQLVESEWGWTEKEFMEIVGDSGRIERQNEEEVRFSKTA